MTRLDCAECGEFEADPGDVICYSCKTSPAKPVVVRDEPDSGDVDHADDVDHAGIAALPGESAIPVVLPPPTDPMGISRAFVRAFHEDRKRLTLRYHHGDFYVYRGRHWAEVDERWVRAALYAWLEDATYETPKGALEAWRPNRRKLGDVAEALAAVAYLDDEREAPMWLVDSDVPANEIISMANGLLHLPTRTLIPHTPGFFNLHSLGFAFDPDAPVPVRWLRFLDELWRGDVGSIQALQEVIGYVLSGATAQQKLFMLVGPKRSGKGTIGRVITGLLGAHHVAAPTLSSLTTNFGLQVLIGKPLALISDARLGSRADGTIAVERLLSISGEDSITVDRKYRDPWTGRLPSRFIVLTNEIPRFSDSSGALASRFVMLVLENTFYGREDPALTDALLVESTGIFNWALEGLDRLTERGYFQVPSSSQTALTQLEDLSSPIGAYVRDRCTVRAGAEVSKDVLYGDYKIWCERDGQRARSKNVFLRDLYAAHPRLRPARVRDAGDREQSRVQSLEGIELRGPNDPDPAESESQSEASLTIPDQTAEPASRSRITTEQNRRSEHVVRDGQGSSASWSEPGPSARLVARVTKDREQVEQP